MFGLPIANVEEVVQVRTSVGLGGRPPSTFTAKRFRSRTSPISSAPKRPPSATRPPAVVVAAAGRRLVAMCDRLLGEEDVVINGLEPPLSSVRGYLGTALLGDGRIALVLDPSELVRAPVRPVERLLPAPAERPPAASSSSRTPSPSASSSAASSKPRVTT